MRLCLRSALASLLLAAGFLAPAARAQEPLDDVVIPEGVLQEQGEYLLLDLSELDDQGLTLRQFIKVCQLNTGLNFTLDETTGAGIRQKLDSKRLLLYGPKRIKRADFYSFFQIMMKIHGYVCVQQGAGDLAVIVITEQLAANSPLIKANAQFVDYQEVESFNDKPGTYLYTVVPLQYADAQDLGTNLRTALASQAGETSAFMPLQQERALLVQGYGPFVAASVRMIRILDKKPPKVEVVYKKIPVREQDAQELADVLTELVDTLTEQARAEGRGRGNQPGDLEPETVVTAFRPDNSLIVTGTVENIEKLMTLVAQLDTRVDDPESAYHVYVLQYLSAKDLEEALKTFVQEAEQEQERASREAASGQPRGGLFSEQRIIVNVHEETNAVLASATRHKWAELKQLLDTLDKRQPQVLIETALIEISEDFEKEIGFEYANVETPEGNTQRGFGFTSVGITTGDALGDARLPSPTAAGLTFGIFDGADLGIPFIVQLAQSRDDANVLSVPSVLVSNNKGAVVSSKDRVPYQTSNATQGTVAANFDFIEAGIALNITPSISAQKYLRLQVQLEVSSFRGEGADGAPPPTTSRRIETSVSLPDGATMWLGGIIRDDVLDSEAGIPYLSDIPLIGFLFGRTTNRNIKTTLFFFCTPKIIEDFEELADVSQGGKARAAETIGLDRVRLIDPAFQAESPVDVILEGAEGGTGTLNLSGFAAPAYETPGGELDLDEVGGARLVPPKD
jgi:general secretion pathway protein D